MISFGLDSLFPRFSGFPFILASMLFADDEVEEEEELSDAAAATLRGAGVGGIMAFFLLILSATVGISKEGRSVRTLVPAGRP